jgi:murein DD-endopeptidase MepM/ murein hydrolase activator NlpD
MLKYVVSPGQHIKKGQIIGYLGNTGHSTAPHLHYEVKLNGIAVNPVKYLNKEIALK